MSARKTAVLGVLISLALIFGWVEHIIPISAAVPGIKLGLGNIVVVYALYRLGGRYALALSVAKVLLSTILFGSFTGFVYSIAGGLCSLAVMLLVRRIPDVSPVGVSAAGGAAHIAAQIAAAILLTSTVQIWRILPVLMMVGTLSGAVVGLIAALVIERTDIERKSDFIE